MVRKEKEKQKTFKQQSFRQEREIVRLNDISDDHLLSEEDEREMNTGNGKNAFSASLDIVQNDLASVIRLPHYKNVCHQTSRDDDVCRPACPL